MNLRAHSEPDSFVKPAAITSAPHSFAARTLVAKSVVKVNVIISASIILLNGNSG